MARYKRYGRDKKKQLRTRDKEKIDNKKKQER